MPKALWLILLFVAGTAFASEAAEAVPEFVTLTLRDGRGVGRNFESARTPVVRTSLRGNVLDVDIQVESRGGGKLEFAIPPTAKKIRIFDCVYDLPPAGHAAFFHSFLLADIRKPWWQFSRDETQRAMMLLSYAPDRRSFEARIWYCGRSGKETWKRKQDLSCIVADDGRIFEKLDADTRSRSGPGIRYRDSYVFRNRNGKMHLRLSVTGRYYKYLERREFVVTDVPLPLPQDRPCTLFFLNQPFMEKYLADSRTGEFALERSIAEFRRFAEN